MNEQDGDANVGATVDFEKVKRVLMLFFASAIRGLIIAAVAKLSPALVEDASVKVTVEVLSTAAAISLVAAVSTRSTLKKVAAAAVAGACEEPPKA